MCRDLQIANVVDCRPSVGVDGGLMTGIARTVKLLLGSSV